MSGHFVKISRGGGPTPKSMFKNYPPPNFFGYLGSRPDSDLVFSATYDTPGLSLWGPMLKRRSAKNFSPLRGESRSVSRPPRVVSQGTIRFPLRPPILGEFRGKAKTLTPNISSPEGGRGHFRCQKMPDGGPYLSSKPQGCGPCLLYTSPSPRD